MNFWLDRGACGYRMDVINLISKDQRFPDAEPVNGPDVKYHPGTKYYVNGPRMHEYIQEMNRKVLSKHGAVTVGEMPCVNDINEIIRTVGKNSGELNMIFIFDIVDIDNAVGLGRMTWRDWTARDLSRIITKWQKAMIEHDGWNTVFVENHDNPRSISRYCDDSDTHRSHSAKLLALLQTTQNGTLFIYQGEELGMRNVPKTWDIDTEYKDIESINSWNASKELYANHPERLEEARRILQRKARDHARTPMQWNASPNAGFCPENISPWMRVNDDYPSINAQSQLATPDSPFHFWQHMLAERKKDADIYVYGDFEAVETESDDIFAYVRTGKKGGNRLVVLNFSGRVVRWGIPESVRVREWTCGNYLDSEKSDEKALERELELRPWEGVWAVCED